MCYFFRLNYFFLIHTLFSSAGKLKVVNTVILLKLYRIPLFHDIYNKTILVSELISVLLINATYYLYTMLVIIC